MSASLLATVEVVSPDPILGVTEAFNSDTNPNRVNLGEEVYCNENGEVPVLDCVRRAEQWEQVISTVNARELVPFLDTAYQGFAEGLDADAAAVRRFTEACPVVFVSSSLSKSLSFYGERVGALSIVVENADEAARALSQLKRVIRTNYSSPPTHGGRVAAMVLTTPELRSLWEKELGGMRERIKTMRGQLVGKIREVRSDFDFSFVTRQRGMFSYSGLTQEQVRRLREEHSVYAINSGRICVAALNSRNIDYVARVIASVLV